MKKTTDFITKNPNIEFSVDEFNTLRAETVERISIMNNQASNAINLILATWIAGFTLLGIQLTNQKDLSTFYLIILSIGQMSAFYLSLLMIIPMATKSGENLRQLISIGMYIKVFYDYLSILKQDSETVSTYYLWEYTDKLLSSFTTSKGKKQLKYRLLNSEYVILSAASALFLFISALLSFNFINAYCHTIYLYILYLLIIISSIILVLFTNYLSSSKRNLMDLSVEYTKKYLIIAADIGIINENGLKNAWKELNPNKKISIEKYEKYFS